MPLRRLPWLFCLLAALHAFAARAQGVPLGREADWLQQYLRFDTRNPPGNELPAVEFLAGRLHEAGATTEILRSPGGRSNLVARLPATVADAPVLVLLHHVDVVPPGEGWSGPPFAGELRDGALFGRGAIDAKSLGIAHLAAVAAAAALPERTREILFLAVADEEAGGGEGAGWLLAAHPELTARVEAVLNEGGTNKSVDDRILYWGIEVEQKRPLWLEVSARGRGGHASSADPASAAHRLIPALARLLAEPAPLTGSRAALAHFERLGKLDPRAARAVAPARKLLAGEPLAEADRAALAGYEPLLQDTLQITTLAASDRVNVVAAEARAAIDARLLPETDADSFLAGLRSRLGPDLDVAVTQRATAVAASPTSSAVYERLAAELGRDAPVVPLFIPAMTDSRLFRERGIPAYGFSPFAIDARELRTVHAADERLSLAAFDRGVARMKRLVTALVTAPSPRP